MTSAASQRDELRREAIAYRSINWPVYTGASPKDQESLSVSMPSNLGITVSSSSNAVSIVWGGNITVLTGHMALPVSGAALLHAGSTGTTVSAAGGMVSLSSGGYLPMGSGLSEGGGTLFAAGGAITFSGASGLTALPQTAAQNLELLDLLALWSEEDASTPDPNFDKDYADLQSNRLKFYSPD